MMKLSLAAWHGACLEVLGVAQGAIFTTATAGENPERLTSLPEASALLAWAATGFQSASDLPLEAIEVATSDGAWRLYRGDDMAVVAGLFGSKFGDYIWRALQVGAGITIDAVGRTENVVVAAGEAGLAVTVLASAGGQTIAGHYGLSAGRLQRSGSLPRNAFRHIAATAPLCVPTGELPYAVRALAEADAPGEAIQ